MIQKIYNQNDSTLLANTMDEVEKVGFREYIIQFHTKSIYPALQIFANKKFGRFADLFKGVIYNQAKEIAIGNFESFASKSVPPAIIEILDKPLKKKEQIRLLKGCELKESQFCALFVLAEKKGYSFSHYRYEGDPSAVMKEELPKFIHLKEDSSVEFFGESSLSEGQMRLVVEQADVLIARILDNGTHWHCFLQTFKGLKGQEGGVQGSRPHLHYISDSFGIAREVLVEMLKRGNYPGTPIHIPLLKDEDKSGG